MHIFLQLSEKYEFLVYNVAVNTDLNETPFSCANHFSFVNMYLYCIFFSSSQTEPIVCHILKSSDVYFFVWTFSLNIYKLTFKWSFC